MHTEEHAHTHRDGRPGLVVDPLCQDRYSAEGQRFVFSMAAWCNACNGFSQPSANAGTRGMFDEGNYSLGTVPLKPHCLLIECHGFGLDSQNTSDTVCLSFIHKLYYTLCYIGNALQCKFSLPNRAQILISQLAVREISEEIENNTYHHACKSIPQGVRKESMKSMGPLLSCEVFVPQSAVPPLPSDCPVYLLPP
jgi:hypothetical protein